MKNLKVKCGTIDISNANKFCLIAGPCQLESEEHALKVSNELKKITNELNINLIYKTSFDKANRTSLNGKRGLGLEKSLSVFDKRIENFGREAYVKNRKATFAYTFYRSDITQYENLHNNIYDNIYNKTFHL